MYEKYKPIIGNSVSLGCLANLLRHNPGPVSCFAYVSFTLSEAAHNKVTPEYFYNNKIGRLLSNKP